jgi:hypothetical protein
MDVLLGTTAVLLGTTTVLLGNVPDTSTRRPIRAGHAPEQMTQLPNTCALCDDPTTPKPIGPSLVASRSSLRQIASRHPKEIQMSKTKSKSKADVITGHRLAAIISALARPNVSA